MQQLEATTFHALWSLSKFPETGVTRMRSSCVYRHRAGAGQGGEGVGSAASASISASVTDTDTDADTDRDHHQQHWASPWYATMVPDYRALTERELPKGMAHGFQFTTVTINVPKYLRWLLDQFQTFGGGKVCGPSRRGGWDVVSLLILVLVPSLSSSSFLPYPRSFLSCPRSFLPCPRPRTYC